MLADVKIKKGTVIRVPVTFLTLRHRLAEAEKYGPERWLNGEMKNLDQITYIPFSAGGRNCVGQYLANIEAAIMIREILRKFEIKCSAGYQLHPVVQFVTEPKEPIPLVLTLKS